MASAQFLQKGKDSKGNNLGTIMAQDMGSFQRSEEVLKLYQEQFGIASSEFDKWYNEEKKNSTTIRKYQLAQSKYKKVEESLKRKKYEDTKTYHLNEQVLETKSNNGQKSIK